MLDFPAFYKGVGVIRRRLYAADIGVGGVAGVNVQVAPVEVALRVERSVFFGWGWYCACRIELRE